MMDTLKKTASNPYVLVGGGFVLGVFAGYLMFKKPMGGGSSGSGNAAPQTP